MKVKGQHWLLLDIHRTRVSQSSPTYALTLHSPSEDEIRLIRHCFPSQTHLLFQLWQCCPGQQHRIEIKLAQIDASSGSVGEVSKASPLVQYSSRGESYKFYGGSQLEQLVLSFKVVQRSALQVSLEREQLKRMNAEMGGYLLTCKAELQQYQDFLSFTNQVITDLNQPTPTPEKDFYSGSSHKEQPHAMLQEYDGSKEKGQPSVGMEKRGVNTSKQTLPPISYLSFKPPQQPSSRHISRNSLKTRQNQREQPIVPELQPGKTITMVSSRSSSVAHEGTPLSKYPYLSSSHSPNTVAAEPIAEQELSGQELTSPPISNQEIRYPSKTQPKMTHSPAGTKERINSSLPDKDQRCCSQREQLTVSIRQRRDQYRVGGVLQTQQKNIAQHETDVPSPLPLGEEREKKPNQLMASNHTHVLEISQIGRVPSKQREKCLTESAADSIFSHQLVNSQYFQPKPQGAMNPHPQGEVHILKHSFLPSLQLNESYCSKEEKTRGEKEEECRAVGQRRKRSRQDNERQGSVVSSDGAPFEVLSKQPERTAVNSRADCFYNISFLSVKSTTYTSSPYAKRCLFSVGLTNYQTSYCSSQSSLAEWSEPILIKGVFHGQMITCYLLAKTPGASILASAHITVKELISCQVNTLRSYLFQDQLAVGFLDVKFAVQRVRSSFNQQDQQGQVKNTRRLAFPLEPSQQGRDSRGHSSRVRQAKLRFFPRLK